MVGDGVVSAHTVIPSNGCRDSFDYECVLWCIDDDDVHDPIQLTERDREKNLGVASGEREGRVGGRGSSFAYFGLGNVLNVSIEFT